jgi:LmbE family N-acetylglucosaminyl deacetylase
MRLLQLALPGERLSVLCLGAHSDDIEIGCGATLLGWMERGARLDVHWVVLGAVGERADEARASAQEFLGGSAHFAVELGQFRDGFFPYQGAELKEWFEDLKSRVAADVVMCHWRDDAHQDHREISRLAWNTFRNHIVLEYEIPKWDGDLGRPNVFIPATRRAIDRKVELLMRHFGTQRSKDWFTPDTFFALARLRGNECRAPEGLAEAFFARKLAFA